MNRSRHVIVGDFKYTTANEMVSETIGEQAIMYLVETDRISDGLQLTELRQIT